MAWSFWIDVFEWVCVCVFECVYVCVFVCGCAHVSVCVMMRLHISWRWFAKLNIFIELAVLGTPFLSLFCQFFAAFTSFSVSAFTCFICQYSHSFWKATDQVSEWKVLLKSKLILTTFAPNRSRFDCTEIVLLHHLHPPYMSLPVV